jgi:hypothetical protein
MVVADPWRREELQMLKFTISRVLFFKNKKTLLPYTVAIKKIVNTVDTAFCT